MSFPESLPRIGAPATRALAGLGITTLDQLAGRSRSELARLHGMGPKALGILDEALAERGTHLGD
jgi:predicted flap endonuclease-1-like 5' DNA nuclease